MITVLRFSFLSLVLTSLFVGASAAQDILVAADAATMYIEPLEDLPNSGNPTGWTARVYDLTQDNGKGDPDTNPNWAAGQHGVGYGDADDNTEIPDDDDTYGIYTRTEFTVVDTGLIGGLQISVDFDDAYIMYINGTEVNRSGTAAAVVDARWDTVGAYGGDPNGVLSAPISIDAHIPLLVNGTNILAMHVFNNTSNSSDITMIAQLTATAAPVEPVVPGDTVFVDVDSNTMYIEPLEDLPNSGNPQGWTATVYDLTQDNGKGDPDTNPNWAAGQHGVGMADGDDNTQIPDDDDTYGIYTRTEFTVDDASLVVGMQIAVDYDDSYIMYINGTEVSRAAEAGSGVDAWNLLGSCKCDSSENGTLEPPISLDAHIPLLVDGTNILAIHVFNNSKTSSDLTMIARLTVDIDNTTPRMPAGGLLALGLAAGIMAAFGASAARRQKK